MAKEDAQDRKLSEADDPKPLLKEAGEEILAALESIFQSAQRALSEGPSGLSRDSLVRPSNMMVGDAKPEREISAKNAEIRSILRRLLEEPLVARVDWCPEGSATVQ